MPKMLSKIERTALQHIVSKEGEVAFPEDVTDKVLDGLVRKGWLQKVHDHGMGMDRYRKTPWGDQVGAAEERKGRLMLRLRGAELDGWPREVDITEGPADLSGEY